MNLLHGTYVKVTVHFFIFKKNQVKPMKLYDTFRYCHFSCSQSTFLLREIRPPGYPPSLGKLWCLEISPLRLLHKYPCEKAWQLLTLYARMLHSLNVHRVQEPCIPSALGNPALKHFLSNSLGLYLCESRDIWQQ